MKSANRKCSAGIINRLVLRYEHKRGQNEMQLTVTEESTSEWYRKGAK